MSTVRGHLRAQRLALGCALALASACGNDLRDLYCAAETCGDAGDAGMDGAAVAARLLSASCEACVRSACRDEVMACTKNDACLTEARCHEECRATGEDDPPCHDACNTGFALGQEPSAPLARCAVERCFETCSLGQDYACRGKYAFPDPTDSVTPLPLQLGQFSSDSGADPLLAQGIRALACPSRDDPACAKPVLGPFVSDATGELDVLLPSGGGNNQRYTAFDGFVLFEDPDEDPPRILPTRLFFDRQAAGNVDARIDALFVTPATPIGPSAGMGFIVGVIFDCRSTNFARGAGLTVEVAPEPLAVVMTGGKHTDPQGAFFAFDAPPGPTHITARFGDEVISEIDVPVVADGVTYVWMWPTTR